MIRQVLNDRFGRRIDYLRLSVTDRCDLRCTYCIPEGFSDFSEPESWLTFDEIVRIVGAFSRLGVGRVRLTGGEPLVRRNLGTLAARLAGIPGIEDLSLSTNGTQLAKQAATLRQAGIHRLNVSLDSLRPDRFARIVRRDCFDQVIDGLMAAKAAGFAPIKINMVALAGVNDDEIDRMVDFCAQYGFVLRLIETMPMGATGRNAEYMDIGQVRERLRLRFNLVDASDSVGGGPATYLRSLDGGIHVGFITPISQHFCDTCNRVRLSTDGTLFMCLGQEAQVNLRALLRGGVSDEELEEAIREAIDLKPLRHEFVEKPHQIVRMMAATGG